ncbi:MAG: RDD family protein [Bacteroidota bacterium]
MDVAFEIRTAQNVPLALEPASIGRRIGATLIDWAVGFSWLFLMLYLLGELRILSWAPFLLIAWLPTFLYHLAMEVYFEGRTLGKMAMKTRVARLDGGQATLSQYLLRWLFRLLDISVSQGLVALMSTAFTKRQQRLGDLAAGTTVVRQRRRLDLNQVLYPLVPDDYEPVFPEAETLTDAEIRTVRAVIARLHLAGRDARSLALAERAKAAIQKRLDLPDVQMRPEPFLRLVVRDHVARLDRFGV